MVKYTHYVAFYESVTSLFRHGTNGLHYLAFWDQTLQISRRRLCNLP